MNNLYEYNKRIFDFIVAIFGIIFTFPIWLISVFCITFTDFGPIFYTACRVGKNNKLFPMYKFRSMRQGKANEAVFRGEEDRIFPWGNFMRKTKIDELPQLLCCLTGTMSIIGPRPAAKDQIEIMRSGQFKEVSNIKPGLSGPAAIYDYIYGDSITNEIEYKEKVLPTRLNLELYYVHNRSFCYDLKLIWYTIVCILFLTLSNRQSDTKNSILQRKIKLILDELVRCSNNI